MARISDNDGNLIGGLELPMERILAPLNKLQRAPGDASAGVPHPTIFGPHEEVRRLVCSYGSLPRVVYSAAGNAPDADAAPVDLHPLNCRNQVDQPQKRHFCPACGGYYCITHADPAAHACESVLK